MIWPTLYFPIFLTDCDFSIKEIYQVFIQAYKRRNFQSWIIRFDPYRPFKTKLSNCVRTALYFSKLLSRNFTFKSYNPLKYFIQVSTKISIFFLFLSAVFFYSIYTILNKFESGTIRLDPHSYF